MSKKRLGVIAALAASFVLAVTAFLGTMFFAQAEEIDASLGRALSVDAIANGDGDAKVSFVINKNLGTAAFTDTSVTGVTYTTAGGTRTLKEVNYFFIDVRPILQLSFEEDTATDRKVAYAEGDTIALTTAFAVENSDGSKSFSLGEAVTVEYASDGWSGAFVGDKITNESVTVSSDQAVYVNGGVGAGGCTLVGFGLKNMTEGGTFIDANGGGGWYDKDTSAPGKLFKHLSKYIELKTADGWVPSRFVFKDGNIAIGDVQSHLSAGATLIVRAGFATYQTTGINTTTNYCMNETDYTPLAILTSDLLYRYDGSAWVAASPATSAEITNQSAAQSMGVGQQVQLEWTLNENAVEPMPAFTSSNPEVVSVSATGMLSALAEGTATITVQFAKISKTFDITIAGEAVISGMEFEIKGAAVKDGKQYLVEYTDRKFDASFAASRLQAKYVYDDGSKGDVFDVTAEMISAAKLDQTKEGVSAVTVTKDDVSGDVPVYVYETKQVDALAPERLVYWGEYLDLWFTDVIDGNEGALVKTIDFRGKPEYGIDNTIATLRDPATGNTGRSYELFTVGHASEKQCILVFNNFKASEKEKFPVGGVLTLNENFRFYRFLDDTWVAAYKFAGPVSYVWDGAAWQKFVADANDFQLVKTDLVVPKGASFSPEVKLLPEGSFATVEMTSSAADIVAVEGNKLAAKAVGKAEITVKLGEKTKVLKVEVKATDSVSLVVANERTFYVAQDGAFDVSKVKVQIDYGDGFVSDEIALSDATAVFTLDTSAAGKKNLEIECTLQVNGVDIEDKVTVMLDVQPIVETYPDNLTCNDDNAWSGTTILIYFQKTFPNQANVFPKDLTEAEGKTITDFVSYTREGATVELDNPGYLTNMLAFTPKIDGVAIAQYQTGDTITLKQGLCFYKWFGETDSTNTPKGDGDFVKVGELKYDVVITYNAQGKFAWNIAPADGKVIEAVVEVGLGETHASNVETIPSYATNGEWFFTEENDKIAKVNANGLISGKGIGETTVTATLKTSDGTVVKTVTYKVKVTDAVAGLKITSDKEIRLDVGADLDIASLIEKFGLKGTVLLASGAEGDSVDLTKARVTGYDAETAGEQVLTFRVTVDGKSVTGTINVQVGKAGGCGSNVAAVSSAAAALLLGAAAIVLLKKKKV